MRWLPPLPGRRQRRLLQADPQPGVREPPPGMPQLRPLCPPGPAQRRHIRLGAGSTPGLNPNEPQRFGRTRKKRIPMWTEYQRHSVRTRKKKSLCGPSTNGIPVGPESRNTMWTDYQRHRQSHNSRGSSSVFFCWHRLFSAPRRFFMPTLRRKSFRSLIYVETDSPYPFPIFRISTFAFRLC